MNTYFALGWYEQGLSLLEELRKLPYVCASCNPNIDKIEIDGEMVNVLGEKRIGEWAFYIFSYNVKGGVTTVLNGKVQQGIRLTYGHHVELYLQYVKSAGNEECCTGMIRGVT